MTGCPFFASKKLIKKAQIVFCPYQYLIDSAIRESTGITFENAIIIIDEVEKEKMEEINENEIEQRNKKRKGNFVSFYKRRRDRIIKKNKQEKKMKQKGKKKE